VDSLLDTRNKGLVKSTLTRLKERSQGPDLLVKAYDDAKSRIEAQLPRDVSLAKTVLSWITCAQRQLTTTELSHALAVYLEYMDKASQKYPNRTSYRPKDINQDYLTDIGEIISVCAGLVIVDD
jgi:hypothetical protein